MKRILWISAHSPLPAQIRELRRVFGNRTVVYCDPHPFSSADDIMDRFKQGGYDEAVVVAPLSVLQRLVERGLRPLWAEMCRIERIENPESDTAAKGRCYRFVRFRRVVGLTVEYEDLE